MYCSSLRTTVLSFFSFSHFSLSSKMRRLSTSNSENRNYRVKRERVKRERVKKERVKREILKRGEE
jgi:Ser/Thr protein kinase RdoA (MazF antagonist)